MLCATFTSFGDGLSCEYGMNVPALIFPKITSWAEKEKYRTAECHWTLILTCNSAAMGMTSCTVPGMYKYFWSIHA